MIASVLAAVLATVAVDGHGLPAARANRFAPNPVTRGAAELTAARAPVRGQPRPTRPRGESFVPGVAGVADPAAALVRPAFKAPDAVSVPDLFEVVFYTRVRPIRLRVFVATDGKSLAGRWEAHLAKLFAAFDRDRSGFLNRYELEHVFPASGIRGMFTGSYYTRANGPPPAMAEVDRDGDGRVSFAEFADHFREVLPDLVRPHVLRGPTGAQDSATAELFARLDADRNGRLSRDELRAAERILLALDADEDECVSSQEVLANPLNRPQLTRSIPAKTGVKTTGSVVNTRPPEDVVVYRSGLPASTVKEVLRRYAQSDPAGPDRDRIGLDPEAFAHLDADSDGRLSAVELETWRTGEPDGVVALTYAESAAGCKVAARPVRGADWPAGLAVRQTEPARLVMRIGPQLLEFIASSPPARRRNQFQQMFGNVFSADTKFVEDRDLVGPENQFLRVVFDAADFNTDGRLTREEFTRYFDLQQSTTELGLALTHATRIPNLFQLLDDNVDGKLGVRELRTAWDRLIVMEPAGAEAVTRDVLQPSVSFRLTAAAFATADPVAEVVGRGRLPAQGPLWFRKMDRNGDGDVSRAEFLGPIADFRALDSNSDDLISRGEAEAYDRTVRPPRKDAKKPAPGSPPDR